MKLNFCAQLVQKWTEISIVCLYLSIVVDETIGNVQNTKIKFDNNIIDDITVTLTLTHIKNKWSIMFVICQFLWAV